jgi:hypothetical protein
MGTQHLVREFNSVKMIFSDGDLISKVKNHYLQIFNFSRHSVPTWQNFPNGKGCPPATAHFIERQLIHTGFFHHAG